VVLDDSLDAQLTLKHVHWNVIGPNLQVGRQ
jgi:DNA-binding ferritin-like protein